MLFNAKFMGIFGKRKIKKYLTFVYFFSIFVYEKLMDFMG